MRAIIYGAGAIGGTVGGHLALAGHEVVLIARGAHGEALREHGLRLVTPGGTHLLRLPVATGPGEVAWQAGDVVLLCVKGQDTEAAVEALVAAAGDVPVFCLQNGVRNEEIAGRCVSRVYGAMVWMGAVHLVPGEVIARRGPPGLLVIGRYPQGVDALCEAVAGALRAAGFDVLVRDDVMRYKWGKLLGNLANAVGAITGAKRGEPGYDRLVEAARDEARGLLERAGIGWASDEEADEALTAARGTLPGQGGNSTWQSLARGAGSVETGFLNGEIVRLAARLGEQAPVNAGLLRIVEAMAAAGERPGRYSPAELAGLLGLEGKGPPGSP